jgi:hypothetical protein
MNILGRKMSGRKIMPTSKLKIFLTTRFARVHRGHGGNI